MLIKKLIAPLLFPLPLCVAILTGGLILLWFTRRQRAGKILVSAGTALLVLFSLNPVAMRLLRPLEGRLPPLDLHALRDANPHVSWIVVLGGGHADDPQVPHGSRLSDESLWRVVEAVRLHRQVPGSRLIFSGGGATDSTTDAEQMAAMALSLGVDAGNIVLETKSHDTEDQASLIKPTVGGEPFILVTSASHMPRAAGLFAKKGMNPIAAPAGYHAKQSPRVKPTDFYPASRALENTERAFYEYLGLAWTSVRGQR